MFSAAFLGTAPGFRSYYYKSQIALRGGEAGGGRVGGRRGDGIPGKSPARDNWSCAGLEQSPPCSGERFTWPVASGAEARRRRRAGLLQAQPPLKYGAAGVWWAGRDSWGPPGSFLAISWRALAHPPPCGPLNLPLPCFHLMLVISPSTALIIFLLLPLH